MIVGLIVWQLHLDGCHSLKDKRRVLKSLKDRLRHRWNLSVAETNHQDVWQRAEIACCVVATDKRRAQHILTEVSRFVNGNANARVIDSKTSYW